MFALLLLVISLLLTVNIRPYETRVLNYLEEFSLLVLMLTQAVSLMYLDADAKAIATGSRDETNEAWATAILLALNAIAFIVLGGAFVIALIRYYGPKVQICLPGDCCASATARVLDETWEEIEIRVANVELVWVDAADGVTIADAPDGVVAKWKHTESGEIVSPIWRGFALPSIEFEVALCDFMTGEPAEMDGSRAPAWRITTTGEFVDLDDVRPCTMWLNSRTGAMSRVNPLTESEVAPQLLLAADGRGAAADIAIAAAAAAAAAAVAAAAAAAVFDVAAADGDADGMLEVSPPLDIEADGPIEFAPPPTTTTPAPASTPAPFVIDMASQHHEFMNPARTALRGAPEVEMPAWSSSATRNAL